MEYTYQTHLLFTSLDIMIIQKFKMKPTTFRDKILSTECLSFERHYKNDNNDGNSFVLCVANFQKNYFFDVNLVYYRPDIDWQQILQLTPLKSDITTNTCFLIQSELEKMIRDKNYRSFK